MSLLSKSVNSLRILELTGHREALCMTDVSFVFAHSH
jgi:hypothetical protein